MSAIVNDRVVYATSGDRGWVFSFEDPSPVPTTDRLFEFAPGCDADYVRHTLGDSTGWDEFVGPAPEPKPKPAKKAKE